MNTQDLGALIPDALIQELKQRFPCKAPSLTATDREIWASVGEQRMIDYLQREHDEVFKQPEDF